jgi:hypothetical protein
VKYIAPAHSHTTVDTFATVTRDEIVEVSNELLSRPAIAITERERIFRIECAGLDWDVGVVVYEPEDSRLIPVGADGKKIGMFLLHGGEGDFKSMQPQATLLASRFGYRVVSATFPGRLYLDDPSRDWPGDTISDDGVVRTPIWQLGEYVGTDQYDVIEDDSMRARYGRRTLAKAKPDSVFRDRLAASPLAMEVAFATAMTNELPESEFSIYVHGHSTGGPYQFMMSQRVPNIEGVLAIENSPFGYINERKHQWSGALGKASNRKRNSQTEESRKDPFDVLSIRTWRDTARYAGAEALGRHGPDALLRLPMIMEDVLDGWQIEKKRPQFKCEYLVTWNIVESLAEAAKHTASRLGLGSDETESLVSRYVGMCSELIGPNIKSVPNVLFGISGNSRDHSPEVYEDVILPMFAAMDPAPLATVTRFQAGRHYYISEEEDLPLGIAPAVFMSWDTAIRTGYFLAR